MTESTALELWRVDGAAIGCDAVSNVGFDFGETRIERLVFDGEALRPDDIRLEWFTLRGGVGDGGPFPPTFDFSPYDRKALDLRPEGEGFGAPFTAGNGFPEVMEGKQRVPVPAVLPDPGKNTTLNFGKAHFGFFACGRHPVLHAISEEGHVEWFATSELLGARRKDKIQGHSYGEPLGRLLPRHQHAVAVGRQGFATVAGGVPVWVRGSPFLGAAQARARCACDSALGAPMRIEGRFLWPVVVDGATKIAVREDGADAAWSFLDCVGAPTDDALAPPHRRDGGVVVWCGREGYLIVDNMQPRWLSWPAGFTSLPQCPPYLDVQGNLWQFGSIVGGFAFARLSSGQQQYAPVAGFHVSGGRFTLQGSDFHEHPTFADRKGALPGVDGVLVAPIMAWENAAVVALVDLPAGLSPDDYYLGGSSTVARSRYRLLSFADLSLRDLSTGVLNSSHYRDLVSFVFEGHLFLTSCRETRCIVWPLTRNC